jgi:hypothetical protein
MRNCALDLARSNCLRQPVSDLAPIEVDLSDLGSERGSSQGG